MAISNCHACMWITVLTHGVMPQSFLSWQSFPTFITEAEMFQQSPPSFKAQRRLEYLCYWHWIQNQPLQQSKLLKSKYSKMGCSRSKPQKECKRHVSFQAACAQHVDSCRNINCSKNCKGCNHIRNSQNKMVEPMTKNMQREGQFDHKYKATGGLVRIWGFGKLEWRH